MPPLVDVALLGALRDAWEHAGARLTQQLSPGASAADVRAFEDRLGITVPDDARTWWQWHDGVSAQAVEAGANEMAPGKYFLSLMECAEQTERVREMMRDAYDDDELDAQWKVGYLNMSAGRNPLVMDCSGPGGAPVIIHSYSYDGGFAGPSGTASMRKLVELWIEAIRREWWVYDKEWIRGPGHGAPASELV